MEFIANLCRAFRSCTAELVSQSTASAVPGADVVPAAKTKSKNIALAS